AKHHDRKADQVGSGFCRYHMRGNRLKYVTKKFPRPPKPAVLGKKRRRRRIRQQSEKSALPGYGRAKFREVDRSS
ncbi:MAG: hypothetical protein OXI13_01170, partial [Gammaproteobacteria bacterium]|nr:hypothetical protein [Gammaproteobacteria bacterium]MDE0478217.1 hypothetical protein [Gammaproteobacteria bacterium]